MQEEEILVCSEIKGISIQSPPVISCCHGNFMFFSTKSGLVQTFDQSNLVTQTIPVSADKIITALAISPSRKIGCVGFKDGSLELYDFVAGKPMKVLQKKESVKRESVEITHVQFLDDQTIMITDIDQWFGIYKMNSLFLGWTLNELFCMEVNEVMRKVIVAPVYSYTVSKNEITYFCLSENFAKVFAVVGDKTVTVYRYDQEKNVIYPYRIHHVENGELAFYLVNQDTLYYSVVGDGNIIIMSINGPSNPEEIFCDSLSKPVRFMRFLSSEVIVIVNEDYTCLVTSFLENISISTDIKVRGNFLDADGGFRVFGECLWYLTMVSFKNKMDVYIGNNDIEGALTLCRRATKGDKAASSGIPSNPKEKALVIERAVTNLLMDHTAGRLKNKEEAEETMTFLLQLAKELRMMNFLVSDALRLFEAAGFLYIYFKMIIAADRKATLFDYQGKEAFIELLLKNYDEPDVDDFLLNLPASLAKVDVLLTYGLAKSKKSFIAQIYLKRLEDLVNAAEVYARNDMWNKVVEIICDYVLVGEDPVPKVDALVEWCLVTDGQTYPILQKLVEMEERDTLMQIGNFIKFRCGPISLDMFVNAYIHTIACMDIPNTSGFYRVAVDFVLLTKAKLSNSSIRYFLSRIFSKTFAEPDDREEMLQSVLKCTENRSLKESLIPICEAYGFYKEKRNIQMETEKYDDVIKDILVNESEDVFAFIRMVIKQGTSGQEAAKKAMFANHGLLIAKNVNEYVDIMLTSFASYVPQLVNTITDSGTRNYFLYSLIEQPNGLESLEMTVQQNTEYITFLCKHYPKKVRKYIAANIKGNIDMVAVMNICKEFTVLDACMFIAAQTQDNGVYEYARDFLESALMDFAEGRVDDVSDAFSFVKGYLTSLPERNRLSKIMIESFILPLYTTKDPVIGNKLADLLLQAFSSANETMMFNHQLKTMITEFAYLPLGAMRKVLCSVVNDYDYDTDAKQSLTRLYQDDERQLSDNYVVERTQGTHFCSHLCGTCGRAANRGLQDVVIFPCGHIFHEKCFDNGVCRICNPTDKLICDDQRQPAKVTSGEMSRKIRRFEMKLKTSTQPRNSTDIEKKGRIQVIRSDSLPL